MVYIWIEQTRGAYNGDNTKETESSQSNDKTGTRSGHYRQPSWTTPRHTPGEGGHSRHSMPHVAMDEHQWRLRASCSLPHPRPSAPGAPSRHIPAARSSNGEPATSCAHSALSNWRAVPR
ncbi:hypothetical protein GDO81_002283 [Engystomops pustulosus]|uniref:Uncharacterized protein n=1 Tax=Engystomops pustulosus TaxID=76066 RepID=A0AAV7DIW3_ENGPU|nr:hypothetical protein GDO81_002283 [Engystomops pustulosus]